MMKDKKLELIDWIKDSLLLSSDLKISLIGRVGAFAEEEVFKLIDFFQKESNYVASDKEGILKFVDKYVDMSLSKENTSLK